MKSVSPGEVALLDWEHHESDTQYLTHNIHRYSGKFIPQIAAQAIELTTHPGDLVVDPYCGSGTALLEAALTGRRSVGIDLNPVASLVSRVKVTPVPGDVLEESFEYFHKGLVQLDGDAQMTFAFHSDGSTYDDIEDEIDADWRMQDEWYTKWFSTSRLRELVGIDLLIRRWADQRTRDVALTALSDVLRKSSNAHSSYPNVMFDRAREVTQSIIPDFLDRLRAIIHAVQQLAEKIDPTVIPSVIHGNATHLPLPDASIDAIVTHPPYIGSIPYAEYGQLSLNWLGYDHRELDRALTGGRRQTKDVVERFERGFDLMIRESHRVLREGSYLFMLLGSPTVRGRTIDLSAMAETLAGRAGFGLAARESRKGTNRRANKMDDEVLLFFEKAL